VGIVCKGIQYSANENCTFFNDIICLHNMKGALKSVERCSSLCWTQDL